jgi:hypothetical protein
MEEVVCQSLGNVCTVQLEGHEHDTSPDHDTKVYLPDKAMLF